MQSIKRQWAGAIRGIALIILNSCHSSEAIRREEFVQRVDQSESAVVLVDIYYAESGAPPYRLNVPENKAYGNMLVELVTDNLLQRQYPIDRGLLVSIGLSQMNPSRHQAVRGSTEDAQQRNAPAFLHPLFERDSTLKEALRALLSRLNEPIYYFGAEDTSAFDEAITLASALECDVLFVLRAELYDKGLLNLYIEEKLPFLSQENVALRLSAFDARTGRIIWSAGASGQHDHITKESLREVALQLLQRLP